MRTKWKKLLKILIWVGIICAIVFGAIHYFKSTKTQKTTARVMEVSVERKNLSVTISGTGAVANTYRQDISPKVNGTVKKVNFNEGESVKTGALMFELDDDVVTKQLDRTRLSIEQAQEDMAKTKKSISNLKIIAPITGQIVGLNAKEDDDINKGTEICSIVDTSRLKLMVPFSKTQISKFYVGQKVDVYLQDYMQVVSGKVSYISRSGKMVAGGGANYDVEVTFDNPGTITADASASAMIDGQMSLGNSKVEYFETKKIRAETGGTINNLFVRENQLISKGQTILTLTNEDLDSQLLANEIKLKDLNTQLESQLKEQDDYKIFAPGNGIIVSQETKVGDVVKAQDVISTIADNGRMEFEISIDELDIAKISLAMKASVTIDALINMRFDGVVTNVANEGTSQNGVTTYPVKIEIKNPEKIKAGMNANADIVIQQKENVLTLPLTAIQKMGNRAFAIVRKQAGDNTQSDTGKSTQDDAGKATQNIGNNSNTNGQNQGGNNRSNSRMQAMLKNYGDDAAIKQITVGINNDSDIEIVDGLSEGDKVLVAITETTTSNSSSNQQMMPSFGGSGGLGGMGGNGSYQRIRSTDSSSGNQSSSGGGQRGSN